jgi:predicted DNA-binding transcriptional regulator YafY
VADTSRRILRLLDLLQSHRYWHGPELADRLKVSARTLRRDIGRLRDLGYAIESVPGIEGGYQLASGAALPPMVFTDDEAVALAIGLRSVAFGGDSPTAEASVRALGKVTAMLPAPVRRRVEQLQHVTVGGPGASMAGPSADVLGVLAQACVDTVRIRFSYQRRQLGHGAADDRDPELGDRYVEPYRLVMRGRRWYLLAFDLDRDDWRTFRVDRLGSPQPGRNTFTPRPLPTDNPSAYLDERIGELRAPSVTVEFDVQLPPEVITERLGRWAHAAPAAMPEWTTVSMTVDDLDNALWTIWHLGVPYAARTPALADHIAHRRAALAPHTASQDAAPDPAGSDSAIR